MIRDEPSIPVVRLRRRDLFGVDVTVAVGPEPVGPIRLVARRISAWTGRPVVRVDVDHEVYLSDPSVLTQVVVRTRG